jgi:hypothetical protein
MRALEGDRVCSGCSIQMVGDDPELDENGLCPECADPYSDSNLYAEGVADAEAGRERNPPSDKFAQRIYDEGYLDGIHNA